MHGSGISAVESERGAISGRGGNGLLTGYDGLLGSLDLLNGLSGDNVGGGGEGHAVVGEIIEVNAAGERAVLDSLGDILAGDVNALHSGGDDALKAELPAQGLQSLPALSLTICVSL